MTGKKSLAVKGGDSEDYCADRYCELEADGSGQ